MKERPQLSAGDYVSLLLAMTRGLGALTYSTLTGWARGEDCPKAYKRHVIYSTMRSAFSGLTVKQFQAVQPTTSEGYQTFCKKQKVTPEVVELEHGATGCFLGPKTAKKTLVWFHGGGYNFAAADEHWGMLWDWIELAKKNGAELRVMVLEYELAPYGVFPLQLKQAVASIQHLLNSGLQPSQILIGGDSAGGNLAAAFMAHLTHTHPSVPAINLSSNVGGALLVSPWVSFTQERASWKSNHKKDALDPATVRIWSENFMGKTPNDNWSQPAEAPAAWWKGLKVDNIAITAGGNEVLRDDIRVFAENIKVHNPQVEYFEAPGEAHDAIIMDKALGLKEDFASEQFMRKWVLARVK
ncbi:putative acetyl-hydrolase [Cladophialophora carrionii]|uniref:Putative acetyl-hydrolase n=1 Tax=Cladophialophora carrionii TaxID=86049 RepID=A0A1C1CCG1_9EURO|nr:putative acetyl-hydrolase [Cladophialophora carrionii]